MNITFLIRSLNYGGAERQLIVLAEGLNEKGHRVGVVVFYSNGPLEKELARAGVWVRTLDKRGRWDVFTFFLRLIDALKQERPDILYSFLPVPNLFAVILKRIFPRIKVVWGVRASNVDLSRYDWLARLTYWLECKLSRFANVIIVNSRAGFAYAVAHGFPKNKMAVIPNGIDTDKFCPDPYARSRVRKEWGVADSEKLIGLVGRLDPMKDHPTFLRAAALLVQERNDVRFVCVGDGPAVYRQELYALCKELMLADRVIWAGTRADMPAVYNALDIATSSSYGEGFPNVIGEAMACGVPCVVTDVGDSAFIVGGLGIVISPKNPVGLKVALEKLLSQISHEHSFKKNCRQQISELYPIPKMVLSTETNLLGLIDRSRKT
jgi:glycosyltransferase involved in cell wall biosynthesis